MDSKAGTNPAVELMIFGRAVMDTFSHSLLIASALVICQEKAKILLNGPNAIRK